MVSLLNKNWDQRMDIEQGRVAWITGHGHAQGDSILEEQVDEILDDREGATDGWTPGRRGSKSLESRK